MKSSVIVALAINVFLATTAIAQLPGTSGFRYSVNDFSGNEQSHQQNRVGNGVNGQYKVLLPDGRLQTVTYVADAGGYRAKVDYTPAAPGEATTAGVPPPIPVGGNGFAASAYGAGAYGAGAYGAGAYGAGAYGAGAYGAGAYGAGAYGAGAYGAGVYGAGAYGAGAYGAGAYGAGPYGAGAYGAGVYGAGAYGAAAYGAGAYGAGAYGAGYGAGAYGAGAYGAGAYGAGAYGTGAYGARSYGSALGYGYGAGYGAGFSSYQPVFGHLNNQIGYSINSPLFNSLSYATPFSQVSSYSSTAY